MLKNEHSIIVTILLNMLYVDHAIIMYCAV